MKNFNEEPIEIILIIAGVFLGTYLFCMACVSVWEGLMACLN